jgi:hypothetical protein
MTEEGSLLRMTEEGSPDRRGVGMTERASLSGLAKIGRALRMITFGGLQSNET